MESRITVGFPTKRRFTDLGSGLYFHRSLGFRPAFLVMHEIVDSLSHRAEKSSVQNTVLGAWAWASTFI